MPTPRQTRLCTIDSASVSRPWVRDRQSNTAGTPLATALVPTQTRLTGAASAEEASASWGLSQKQRHHRLGEPQRLRDVPDRQSTAAQFDSSGPERGLVTGRG